MKRLLSIRTFLLLLWSCMLAGCELDEIPDQATIVEPEIPTEPETETLSVDFSLQQAGDCPALPCVVTFSNTSENGDSYAWKFGDDSVPEVLSTTEQTEHSYLHHGTYQVTLVGERGSEKDSTTKSLAINPTTFLTSLNGQNKDLSPSKLIVTQDQGFLVAGTFEASENNSDAFLFKIDGEGNENWFKPYGITSQSEEGYAVVERDNSGFMLVGTDFRGGDFYVIKTDESGNQLDSWTYGGSDIETAFDIEKTSDGNYAIIGEGCCNYTSNPSYDYLFIKIGDNGSQLAQEVFGYGGNEYPSAITPTSDGGFIITGNAWNSFGSDDNEFYVVKTNANGATQWDENYGSVGQTDYGTEVIEASSGNFVMSGGSSDPSFAGAMIIQTNSSGNELGKASFGGSRAVGNSLVETADGGFMVLGHREAGGNKDIYLYKVDKELNFLWDESFGGSGEDMGYSIKPCTDGGFIIMGSSTSFSGRRDVFMIKINSEGKVL